MLRGFWWRNRPAVWREKEALTKWWINSSISTQNRHTRSIHAHTHTCGDVHMQPVKYQLLTTHCLAFDESIIISLVVDTTNHLSAVCFDCDSRGADSSSSTFFSFSQCQFWFQHFMLLIRAIVITVFRLWLVSTNVVVGVELCKFREWFSSAVNITISLSPMCIIADFTTNGWKNVTTCLLLLHIVVLPCLYCPIRLALRLLLLLCYCYCLCLLLFVCLFLSVRLFLFVSFRIRCV